METTATKQNNGRVLQVIGPVVDVEFDQGLPEINTALRISNPAISDQPGNLTVEVAQHLGEHGVRCVAMDTTDGLVRGMPVENTGTPIQSDSQVVKPNNSRCGALPSNRIWSGSTPPWHSRDRSHSCVEPSHNPVDLISSREPATRRNI